MWYPNFYGLCDFRSEIISWKLDYMKTAGYKYSSCTLFSEKQTSILVYLKVLNNVILTDLFAVLITAYFRNLCPT